MLLLHTIGELTHHPAVAVDDSLPLPQRVGHAVDIVVDFVGGSGQIIHLRLELSDDRPDVPLLLLQCGLQFTASGTQNTHLL